MSVTPPLIELARKASKASVIGTVPFSITTCGARSSIVAPVSSWRKVATRPLPDSRTRSS